MRRAPQEIRTYFITAVTANRRRIFRVTRNADLMLETLQTYRLKKNFELHAFVVMPDHIHLLLTPAPEISLEKTMQLIKGGYSFRLKSKLNVWERGYFERRITDSDAYNSTQAYVEQNPVRAGLVSSVYEFPYSSTSQSALTDPRPTWFPEHQG